MEGKESKRVAAWATNIGAGELPPQRISSVLNYFMRVDDPP